MDGFMVSMLQSLWGMGSWTYHGRQRRVQAGFCLAVVSVAVLVAAAVVHEANLQVHPTL